MVGSLKKLLLGSFLIVIMILYFTIDSIYVSRVKHRAPLLDYHWNSMTHCDEENQLQYVWNKEKGRPFHPNQSSLSYLGFPLTNFVKLTNSTLTDYVFVTAANQPYAERCMFTISTMQKYYPEKKIIFYDIGLKPSSVKQFQALCNVEYHKFPFEKFPKHVNPSTTKRYSWKLLVLHEVLRNYTGFRWLDASIRLKDNDTEKVFDKVRQTNGIALSLAAGHSNFATTTEETASYLVTDDKSQKVTMQSGSGLMFIYRTKEVYENIIKWATLCALEDGCMDHGTTTCHFNGNNVWAQCSRFDQTVINLLCSNHYGFNALNYHEGDSSIFKGSGKDIGYEIKTCGNTTVV